MREFRKSDIVNSLFIKICVINFIMMFAQTMTNTLIPKFVDFMGATPMLIGMVTSVFSISSLLIKPISGPAIDSFNKRNILFIGAILIVLAFFCYSISDNIAMIIFSRLLHGCGLGFTVITCLTIVSDAVPYQKLTTGIAYFSVAGAIAQALGPSVGLFLSELVGYSMTFLISMFVILASAVLILTIKSPINKGKKFRITWQNIVAKEALIPAIIMLFLASVFTNISSFLVLYATSINISGIGLYFSVNALFLLVSRPLVGKLSDKFGAVKVLPYAILCFAISMIMISFSTTLFMLLIAAVVNAFGYGACQPLIQSLCMKSVPPDRRGCASATSYYGTDIGYLLGPILAGSLVEHHGYAIMFRSMALLLIIALCLVFSYRKRLLSIENSVVSE